MKSYHSLWIKVQWLFLKSNFGLQTLFTPFILNGFYFHSDMIVLVELAVNKRHTTIKQKNTWSQKADTDKPMTQRFYFNFLAGNGDRQ